MENNINDGLRTTPNMEYNWRITAKWAMFFAVLGFIATGLYLLGALVIIPAFQSMAAMGVMPEPVSSVVGSLGWLFILLYLGFVAIMFFLAYFHLKFSNGITRAVNFTDQAAFENAWRNMRNFFRLNGIFTIVGIVLYIIIIIVAATMAGSAVEQLNEFN